ncbi:MAG: hypothetical protein R3E89_19590 [Thiolinea sp.]
MPKPPPSSRPIAWKLYDWSQEDRQQFRDAAQAIWPEFATSDEAKALVEVHELH